jgi:hypothetical protein
MQSAHLVAINHQPRPTEMLCAPLSLQTGYRSDSPLGTPDTLLLRDRGRMASTASRKCRTSRDTPQCGFASSRRHLSTAVVVQGGGNSRESLSRLQNMSRSNLRARASANICWNRGRLSLPEMAKLSLLSDKELHQLVTL